MGPQKGAKKGPQNITTTPTSLAKRFPKTKNNAETANIIFLIYFPVSFANGSQLTENENNYHYQ